MDIDLVTIGVMTYNQENYILDTLMSIVGQIYENIELIILDDHSVDNTVQRIQDIDRVLKKRFVNYKMIVHKKNSGNISNNCNELLQYAHGRYFKVLGGDDMLLPDYVSVAVNTLEYTPQASVFFSNMYVVDERYRLGEDYINKEKFVNGPIPEDCSKMFHELLYGNFLPAPGFLFKTKILYEIDGFDEEFSVEDYAMWLKLSSHNIPFVYNDRPYVLYRVSGISLSVFSNEDANKRIKKFINISDNLIRTGDKYFSSLDKKDYCKFMGIMMENLALLCCHLKIPQESHYLDYEIEKRCLPLSAEVFVEDNAQISIFQRWQRPGAVEEFNKYLIRNNIDTIGVYGYGARGKRLIRFLKNMNVHISYLIDQRGQVLTNEYHVYKPEESFPKVDAIIISPYHVSSLQFKEMLMRHGCRKAIELEDILFYTY